MHTYKNTTSHATRNSLHLMLHTHTFTYTHTHIHADYLVISIWKSMVHRESCCGYRIFDSLPRNQELFKASVYQGMFVCVFVCMLACVCMCVCIHKDVAFCLTRTRLLTSLVACPCAHARMHVPLRMFPPYYDAPMYVRRHTECGGIGQLLSKVLN